MNIPKYIKKLGDVVTNINMLYICNTDKQV